jgi:hypothetical protein
MPCTEVKATKYQTRKSPPFHAGDCKNLTKKGKNGDYVSKADAKGTYKWVRATRKTKGKSYLIHNNRALPFKVEVSGKSVEIYKGVYQNPKDLNNDKMDYDKLLKKLTVKEVFIGESPCIPGADDCGAATVGNSILLHVSGKKYIYVGSEIYEFTIDDEVDAYYSLVGNNDVPYPVLLGTENAYFLLEKAYVPRDVFKTKMTAASWADAYQYFYGFSDLETGEKITCAQVAKKDRRACQMHRKEISSTKIKGYKLIAKA